MYDQQRIVFISLNFLIVLLIYFLSTRLTKVQLRYIYSADGRQILRSQNLGKLEEMSADSSGTLQARDISNQMSYNGFGHNLSNWTEHNKRIPFVRSNISTDFVDRKMPSANLSGISTRNTALKSFLILNKTQKQNFSDTERNTKIGLSIKPKLYLRKELSSGTSFTMCPNLLRPYKNTLDIRNNFWHAEKLIETKNSNDRIYAVCAYYDDRPVFNGTVNLRIFAALSEPLSHLIRRTTTFCYLWVNGIVNPVIVEMQKHMSDGRRTIQVGDTIFKHWILSCEVPGEIVKNRHLKITNVSISARRCQPSTSYIPVVYPEKPTSWEHTFGMCESNGASFGFMTDEFAAWLIEWFEANILFGITEFNIYNGTTQMSHAVKRVLDYYQEKGILLFHQHPPPLTGFPPGGRDLAHIGMRSSLNDCLYRNMYRYKYAVTIDLDEIIVPYKHDNYKELVQYLGENKGNFTSSYKVNANAFYHTFLGKDNQKLQSELPLKTTQYLRSITDRRLKSFFNPRICLGAFAHYCLTTIQNGPKVTKWVFPQYALVHHYRNTCLKGGSSTNGTYSEYYCNHMMSKQRNRHRMLHFKDELYENVLRVSKQLDVELVY